MTRRTIKQAVKNQEEEFKKIRMDIKKENKISWEKATDLACEAFDCIYGTQENLYKTRIFDWVGVTKRINNMKIDLENRKSDFDDRDIYYLTDSRPSYNIFFFHGKRLLKLFNSQNMNEIMDYIQTLKERYEVSSAYMANYYNYNYGFYDSDEFEIHLLKIKNQTLKYS